MLGFLRSSLNLERSVKFERKSVQRIRVYTKRLIIQVYTFNYVQIRWPHRILRFFGEKFNDPRIYTP
jgi:hypothetical protein